jgi:hypothetical protein
MADNAKVFEELNLNLEGFAEEFADLFMDRVVRRTPVRTGLLASSWESQVSDDGITISNDVDYAAHVEYGTYKMAPRRMLTTTIMEADDIAAEAARNVGLT